MVMDILRFDLAVISVSKHLNRLEKIPIMWPGTVPTRRFHCSRELLCDFCVFWVIQNELLDWLISPCELILVAHELFRRVIQHIHLEGLSNKFYRNSIICFREQKGFVLKIVFYSHLA